MLEFSVDDSGQAGVIILDGDLTIQKAGELKKSLEEIQDKAQTLSVKVEEVTKIDLACLQVLCAFHRALVKGGKSLALTGTLSEAFIESCKTAGFLNCVPDSNSGLWTGVAG